MGLTTKKNMHAIVMRNKANNELRCTVVCNGNDGMIVNSDDSVSVVGIFSFKGQVILDSLAVEVPEQKEREPTPMPELVVVDTERRDKSLDDMKAHALFLAVTFGTKLELKHVKNLLNKVK